MWGIQFEKNAKALLHIDNNDIKQKLFNCIFNSNGVDYQTLNSLIPYLDEDDLAIILKYDKDYDISFLLSIANIAYEDDMTRQALFLLKRHNLSYIFPLLPYIDEEEIQEKYIKKECY